jgi:hypothetical protein
MAMGNFKDPTGLARAAMVALCAYMLLKGLLSVLEFGASPEDPAVGLAAIGYLVALLASYVLVGCWIYRTNANAHLFSDAMSITPGWSIGWFFIPFANLVMPYRGVEETWKGSHQAAGRYEEAESSLVGWWWGLWIATNVSSNLEVFFGGNSPQALEIARYVILISAAISVAAGIVLIQLMRRLDRAQLDASRGSVFA